MRVLLDTCTFLWILTDAEALSGRAKETFADPGNEVLLSAVSAWEIAVKYQLGRLPLPLPPSDYVPAQRDRHRIAPLPLDEESALALHKLPGIHRDPFDRMLVCQAVVHGCALLTPDPWITQYPVRCLW